jgi:hypothetical protein
MAMRKGPVACACLGVAIVACVRVLGVDDVTYIGNGGVDAGTEAMSGDGSDASSTPVDADASPLPVDAPVDALPDVQILCDDPPSCPAATESCCVFPGAAPGTCIPFSTLDGCEVAGDSGYVIACDRPLDCVVQGHPGWACCVQQEGSVGHSHCAPNCTGPVSIMCDETDLGSCPPDLPSCEVPNISGLKKYRICCPGDGGRAPNCF